MAAPSSSVRFAVVGVGLIGPRHAAAIQQDPDAVLTCIVDPSPNVKIKGQDLGVSVYSSVQEMLGSTDTPDAAIVCTPNHTHVPVSMDLLRGGIHVLVEKPISTEVENAKELVALAKTRNLKLLVGHHRRFNKYIVAAKSVLSSSQPELGRPLAVNGLWTLYKPLEYFLPPTEWRQQPDSGGPILINLIHEIDLLHHLLGPIVRVQAERGPDIESVRGRDHKAESCAAITLRFASGAVGTFILADNTPSPFNFESGTGENPTIPQTGMDFYRIFCDNGVLSVPDMRIWRYQTEKGSNKSWTAEIAEEAIDVPEMKKPFELQVAHFVKVIRGEEEPNCTGEEGRRALVVCKAVKEAMKNGTGVEIKV